MVRKQRYVPKGNSEKATASISNNKKFRDPVYHKERVKNDNSNLFPRFRHSRTSEIITSFSDTQYINMMTHYLEHADADSKTGFKNLLIAMYKEGRTSGNMKDVVSAEETAFSVAGLNAFMVLFELIGQGVVNEFLANPAQSDTNGASSNAPACFTYTSYVHLISTLENKGVCVPNVIIKMLKELCFVIKFQDSYNVGAKSLPPRYFYPWTPDMTLAEMEAFTTEWAANNALARLHMDKFGISYSEFKSEMVFSVPEISPSDVKAMAYFNHMPYKIRGDGATYTLWPVVDMSDGTNWNTIPLYFKDSPGEAPLRALAPLFHGYHADNNQYGGILSGRMTAATQNYISVMSSSYDNTSTWTCGDWGDDFPLFFLASYKMTNVYNVSITGTYRTADTDLTMWLWASMNGFLYATGLGKTAWEDILKTYCIQACYGGGSKDATR
jgi:hypothetical protein